MTTLELELAVKCLKDAIDNENDDDTTNAVGNFSSALAHFAIFAVNNETMVPQLKEEIQFHIKSCQNHLEKINLTQKGKKKPPDLCGMETVKADLMHALITPIKRPKVFSMGINPYKGFLLYGAEDCQCCTPILLYDDVLEALREANPTVDLKEVAELEKFAEEKGHGNVHYNRDLPKPRTFVGTIVDFFAEFFA
ncbi:hypothetical protein Bhyg_03207 [Pseudolycoriella hygida]|uniref:Uncharacterized protein n=1 Tax=Pseudolycoriella hygida TaxID=35572 RepID=A0A9Q0NDN1_9DIPT|nr:hypothetical protein Bhyg_03207 [Pseudolycoriella hygida]